MIFEGWCVGFRALSDQDVEKTWKAAKAGSESKGDAYEGRLGRLELESVLFVNEKLKSYDQLTE